MKDKNNVELVRGDLVLVTFDTPVISPTELVMYLEIETRVIKVNPTNGQETTKTTRTLKYYPLTDEGLEVAKTDAGVSQVKFHREKKFTITNVESKHLLKLPSSSVREYKKTLYDQIVALL